MDIHEKILQLRKVVPKNGATEAEAITALKLADKLMTKHSVSEKELEQVQFTKDMKQGIVDNHKKSQNPTAKLCGVVIARFCEVEVWSDYDEQNRHVIYFFGLKQDVEMAEFLYEVIRKAMERGWKDYLVEGDHPKISQHKLFWSYRYGFASRINYKLNVMMEARKPKGELTGTDLMVFKKQMVEQAMDEMFPELNFRNPRNIKIKLHNKVYAEGASSGERVNLNRPLREEGSQKFLS